MHEALIDLFRQRTRLAPELLEEALGVALPAYDDVRTEDATLTHIRPSITRTAWAAEPIALGPQGTFTPWVLGPAVVQRIEAPVRAERAPKLTVLSPRSPTVSPNPSARSTAIIASASAQGTSDSIGKKRPLSAWSELTFEQLLGKLYPANIARLHVSNALGDCELRACSERPWVRRWRIAHHIEVGTALYELVGVVFTGAG
ncbi:MAG: hypothetical protein RIU46_38915 [Deltaproteobacteria bacterium]